MKLKALENVFILKIGIYTVQKIPFVPVMKWIFKG